MKKLFTILCFIIPVLAAAQPGAVDDTTRYQWYKQTYGQRMPRAWYDSVLRGPIDTLKSKWGYAQIDTAFYLGNGVKWTRIGGGGAADILEDLTLITDRGEPYDPVYGSSMIYLPPAWLGRRIRMYRNGTLFLTYTRSVGAITFNSFGDMTQEGEVFTFSNY